MGQHGYAVMLVRPDEGELLTEIEKLINQELPQLEAPWIVKSTLPEPEPEPASDQPEVRTSNRLTEALHRSETLESYGLRPVRRTLGSRFRSSRRRR